MVTSTRDTFQGMFDDDDTLAYEPASTAAIILTGGDEEAEAAALAVLPLPSSCQQAYQPPSRQCLGRK